MPRALAETPDAESVSDPACGDKGPVAHRIPQSVRTWNSLTTGARRLACEVARSQPLTAGLVSCGRALS
jgi:hypothetical protein